MQQSALNFSEGYIDKTFPSNSTKDKWLAAFPCGHRAMQ